jgi:hypothetical protein
MASSSTVYDVKVRYSLDNKASSGANKLAGDMDRAGRSAMSLRGAIAGLGLAGAFVAGKKALIDFNSEIDQMRIGMTTILTMQLKKPWDDAKKSADGLFVRFQELAKKSPATTKDFITMANALTPVIASMGGGVDKIEKLTQGAVLAGLATGTRADVAALDVKQMLLGNVTQRDMMANQLIAAKGMDKETFNDMDAAARASMVESMLQDPALLKAADEFGKSFAGQVSTFQDQLQMALGNVGKPLMAAMTDEVKKWNNWIEKHPRTIAKIVTQVGGMIKDAFGFVRDAAGWLVDNSGTILTIGKTFLVFKGAQMATNIFANFVGGINNLVGQMRNAGGTLMGMFTGAGGLGGAFKGLIGILSGAGGVIPIFAMLATSVSSLINTLSSWDNATKQKNRLNFDEAMGASANMVSRLQEIDKIIEKRNAQQDNSKDWTLFDPKSDDLRKRLNTERDALKTQLTDPAIMGPILRSISDAQMKAGLPSFQYAATDVDSMDKMFRKGSSFDEFNALWGGKADSELVSNLNELYKRLGDLDVSAKRHIFEAAFPEQFGKPPAPMDTSAGEASQWKDPGAADKTNINVTIHRIEVAADDPDHFVFGMVKALRGVSKNPTQAASAIGD